MKVLDLFSGIGGFSLGLERAGFETVAFCEIEPFCRKVLKKHWPDVPIYNDVRELTFERLESDGITGIDVITGGFPCQDISVAGKQAGIEGERSGLWSECARLLGDIRPRYAIFENVTALISGERGKWFERVLWDISQVGYDAEWHCIPASELGAHHHRDRVWIIAYPNGNSEPASALDAGKVWLSTNAAGPGDNRTSEETSCATKRQDWGQAKQSTIYGGLQSMADTSRNRLQGQRQNWGVTGQARLCGGAWWDKIKEISTTTAGWEIEPDVGRVANGIPDRSHRLKGLGNAVVPQIPELIGRAIMETQANETV